MAFCYYLSYFSYLKILRMYMLMSPNCEKRFYWHELERKKAETSLCWQNLYSQSYGFCSSHLDVRVGPQRCGVPNNWCFWIVVLGKTLENSLDWREIKPVNFKGNQPWISIGRTDAETEAPIIWPPDVKSRFIEKDSDAGKDWRQEKGSIEDEMVG